METPDILVSYVKRLHACVVSWRPDIDKRPQPIGLSARWLDHNKWSVPALSARDLLGYFKDYHPTKRVSFDREAAQLISEQLEREASTTSLALAEDGEVPEVLSITMRPFQRAALAYAIRGIPRKLIALDTGLGKTAVASAYARIRQSRTLWVTKASLTINLQREIEKLTSQKSVILRGTHPNPYDLSLLQDTGYQHYVISYDSLSRGLSVDEDTSKSASLWAVALNHLGGFDLLVIDEAHNIRNRNTKRYKTAKDLAGIPAVLLLTASPIINRGTDYFPLLNILDSKTFGSEIEFIRAYLTYDGRSIAQPRKLQHDLLPYMFRRKKMDVLKDLPAKIRQTHSVELEGEWKRKYEDVIQGLYTDLRGRTKDVPDIILAKINRFRQVVSQAKIEHTVEFARTLEESGEKCLVFTAWKETAYELGKQLFCDVITGDVPQEERMRMQDKFNSDPQTKHLVLMFQVGGEGLNLTGASAVVNNDFMWTPEDHNQAEGRAWGRLNDPHGLLVYSVAVSGSIDHFIVDEILRRKQATIDAGVDGQRGFLEANKSMISEFIGWFNQARKN